jgi:hypothetical protein
LKSTDELITELEKLSKLKPVGPTTALPLTELVFQKESCIGLADTGVPSLV